MYNIYVENFKIWTSPGINGCVISNIQSSAQIRCCISACMINPIHEASTNTPRLWPGSGL